LIRKFCVVSILELTALPAALFGQANAVDAAVNGYITDSSGRARGSASAAKSPAIR